MPDSDRLEAIRGQNLAEVVRVPTAAQSAADADDTYVALYDERTANDPSGDTPAMEEWVTEVLGAWYAPQAAITGAATNYASVQLVDLAADGTVAAVLGSLDFVLNTNGVANVPVAIPTVVGKTVAPGHSVGVRQHQTLTGLALPIGQVQVNYARQGIA